MKRPKVSCIYRFIAPVCFAAVFFIASPLNAQTFVPPLPEPIPPGGAPVRGDSAMAIRYALWAKNIIDQNQWDIALAGLERASDFASVSSDISYLLALARSHEKKPLGSVLDALDQALAVDRWNMYSPEAARLMKADTLIAIRAYPQALAELSMVGSSPRQAELTLKAFAAFRPDEFLIFLTDTLDRYPRECGPVRIFLHYLHKMNAEGRSPGSDELQLLELVTRRLPVLLLKDQELAWMAAPFMWDRTEAARLVSAYRAVNKPAPASLPVALSLGVIDEETALEELFAATSGDATKTPLDMALLTEIWNLLRREEARSVFRRNLSAFTGVITEDTDSDGIPETSAEYYRGILKTSVYNALQDGVPDLTLYYEAGEPRRALTIVPPGTTDKSGAPAAAYEAGVEWERYPAVLEAELNGVRYLPRPLDLNFSPVAFVELWGSGVLFPQRDRLSPPLTRRVLVLHSLRVERPSLEFSGGTEVVELNRGIPVRAREYVGELMVSETEFLRGRPQLQRLDLNLDGRMDTVRHFRRSYRPVELEDLWDYDRDIDAVSEWDGEYGQ